MALFFEIWLSDHGRSACAGFQILVAVLVSESPDDYGSKAFVGQDIDDSIERVWVELELQQVAHYEAELLSGHGI